jgi:uncharacterized protein YdiU (UPF0061 family)
MLVNDAAPLQQVLEDYKSRYQVLHLEMMMQKTGLYHSQQDDTALFRTLETQLQLHETDMTIFYRELCKINATTSIAAAFQIIQKAFYNSDTLQETHKQTWLQWLEKYISRIKIDKLQDGGDDIAFAKARTQQMNKINPKYVLRNYIAQLVIDDATKGDTTLLQEIYTMLQHPYDEQPQFKKWYAPRPEWARSKVGCSMLSCSS